MLFHHDNVPAHTSAVATAKLVELHYELLARPAYSPFLNKSLAGQKFESSEKVIASTEAYFADF